MAGGLRVGFIACAPELAQRLTDQKMLATLTTSEVSERVVHAVLSEGHYRKHLDRLRGKLDAARDRTLRELERGERNSKDVKLAAVRHIFQTGA